MTHDDNPGCLPQLFGWLGLKQKDTARETWTNEAHETLPFRIRDDFLSPAEASFFQVLRSAAGENLLVFPKVSLKDLFYVARPDKNISYNNQINQKHVDFVLCDPSTLKPILAVELDDSSHQRADRASRDEFVNRVFQDAGLPLLRFPVKPSYPIQEIRSSVMLFSKSAQTPLQSEKKDGEPVALNEPAPNCPKCGSPMILRTATRGTQAGKQFYGCSNYPNCRCVLPVEKLPA
jgi:predicted RNA-binding Zn-ribbon protein involved in translation (DUF1610 family)